MSSVQPFQFEPMCDPGEEPVGSGEEIKQKFRSIILRGLETQNGVFAAVIAGLCARPTNVFVVKNLRSRIRSLMNQVCFRLNFYFFVLKRKQCLLYVLCRSVELL